MEMLSDWGIPALVVGALGALTIAFAFVIGRWIDSQSNTVVDEPREGPRKR